MTKQFFSAIFLCTILVFFTGHCGVLLAGDNKTMYLDELLVVEPIIQGNQVDDFGALTTIIDEEQIKRLNAQDLGTALRKTPGVSISRYNPVGSFGGGEGGAVFIRGLGSSRPGSEIKTYVDGVPMYMSVWNHPLLDLMSIDPASSIEVYKGPQPQKFGNAFSAVNIVPKKHSQEGYVTKGQVAGGSYSTLVSKAEHGGKKGPWNYYLGGGYRTSNGHRDDADGTMGDMYGRLGYKLTPNWDVSLFALGTDNKASDPGAKGEPDWKKEGTYKTRSLLTALSLKHKYPHFQGSLKMYNNIGEGDWLDNPVNSTGSENLYNNFQYYGLRAKEKIQLWSNGELLTGLDWEVTKGDYDKDLSNGKKESWDGEDITITSPYLGITQLLGQTSGAYLMPSAGIRYTEHSEFDSEWAPYAGVIVGYKETELRFNYSRGVVYPGLDVQVFSEKVIPVLGKSWKNLDPELVDHFEVGLSHRFSQKLKTDMSLFLDEGQDRYVFSFSPKPAYRNIEDFRIQGLEGTINYNPLNNLALFAGVTLLDTDPGDMPYAPDYSLSFGVNWSFLEKFSLSLDSEYLSKMHVNSQARKAGAKNNQEVGSYFLLNGKLSYEFNLTGSDLKGEVFIAGENLTDTEYEYLPDYPMPGINGMLGISFEL